MKYKIKKLKTPAIQILVFNLISWLLIIQVFCNPWDAEAGLSMFYLMALSALMFVIYKKITLNVGMWMLLVIFAGCLIGVITYDLFHAKDKLGVLGMALGVFFLATGIIVAQITEYLSGISVIAIRTFYNKQKT
ncbi:MAG: hypothetical protein KBB86_02630 [Candidatus Pacebacteria bacterium]|nr:hypothetical protein [Candidatus Paceibacterota bacterium]